MRCKKMSRISIVKVNTLQGRVKLMAEADGLEPNDLVILSVSLEKIIGSPVEYLLKQIEDEEVQSSEQSMIKEGNT